MRVLVSRRTDLVELGVASARQITEAPAQSGSTAHFNVGVLPSVGSTGSYILQKVLDRCEKNYKNMNSFFGFAGPSFNITITALSQGIDGSGGAFHPTCRDANITVDACISPIVKPLITCALIVAEMVEVYQAIQSGGWDCGATNGEGLSRVLAEEEYPGVLDDYAVASRWLDSFRPDFVNVNEQTDRDELSNGCSVLFLNYLCSHLGHSWERICANPAPNLAGTYRKLTGDDSDPFPAFSNLLAQQFPPGTPSGLSSDNPFIRVDGSPSSGHA